MNVIINVMNVLRNVTLWYNIFLNEKLMTTVSDTCQMHPYFPYITSMQSFTHMPQLFLFYPDYLKTPNAKDVCSILNMFNTSINNIYFLQP